MSTPAVMPAGSLPGRGHHHVKGELEPTPHPPWVAEMIRANEPDWTRVLAAPIFTSTMAGEMPETAWRRTLLDFFCVVEAFPKYMGVTLAKTTYGRYPGDQLARQWLIRNIRVEASHAQWFIDWGTAYGITEAEMVNHRPAPETAAVHEYLWSMAHRGSLAEAVGAINYAIEGTTGDWSRMVLPAFVERYGKSNPALRWLDQHAEYDDAHPREALEIVKAAARPEELDNVGSAVRRSLELFARGFEACSREDAPPGR
jgi:pyrroloquinoline quinone (PQQ) biosynthesis protein C